MGESVCEKHNSDGKTVMEDIDLFESLDLAIGSNETCTSEYGCTSDSDPDLTKEALEDCAAEESKRHGHFEALLELGLLAAEEIRS